MQDTLIRYSYKLGNYHPDILIEDIQKKWCTTLSTKERERAATEVVSFSL